MNLVLSHCFVNVSDPDEALAFYRDVLELEVRTDVSAEGFRWITPSTTSQPSFTGFPSNIVHPRNVFPSNSGWSSALVFASRIGS